MKTPLKSNRYSKEAYQEKQDERELWYKIVVRVMRWVDDTPNDPDLPNIKKLTPLEWGAYCKRMLAINVTYGKDRTMDKLKKMEQLIKEHNGFE